MDSCLRALALVLAAVLLGGGTMIYRHVDQHGNVSFSDQPSPDAEEVELEGTSTYRSREPAERPARPAPDPEPESPYERVRIISPTHEGTVRDNEGRVTVRTETHPPLRDRHLLLLLVDGEPRGAPQRGYSFQVENVHRGEHTVQVQVVDREGRPVAESERHTFYMHQASQLFPQRQGPPGTGITPGPTP